MGFWGTKAFVAVFRHVEMRGNGVNMVFDGIASCFLVLMWCRLWWWCVWCFVSLVVVIGLSAVVCGLGCGWLLCGGVGIWLLCVFCG